jgi:hypothetical protein
MSRRQKTRDPWSDFEREQDPSKRRYGRTPRNARDVDSFERLRERRGAEIRRALERLVEEYELERELSEYEDYLH